MFTPSFLKEIKNFEGNNNIVTNIAILKSSLKGGGGGEIMLEITFLNLFAKILDIISYEILQRLTDL